MENSCCKFKSLNSHHNEHGNKKHSALSAAAHATLHCLTGCVIGEFIGLAIGVSIGLHPYATIILSTALAYLSGFTLTIVPLMRRTGLKFMSALKAIWFGEAVSIGIMELVMNSVDYHIGGMRAGSLANLLFWEALAIAVIAGFIAAFPVNAWLISKQLKKCH